MSERELTIGQMASLACLLEVTASKPGNVHRGADFEDVTFLDFATSAVVIGRALDAAPGRRLGETVLAAVQATRQAVATNTNLGTILLLVPMALVPRGDALQAGVPKVLEGLDPQDSRLVYQAIRVAQPGGLGQTSEADVAGEAPASLVAAMRLAASRDMVARQYADGFAEIFGHVLPALRDGIKRGWPLGDAIIRAHLTLMRDFPDSLIARKCGLPVAEQAAARAGRTLEAGLPGEEDFVLALEDFDFWLRSDHHRRNPGTTADLIAAGLFAALREGLIAPPFNFYR
jgi:triphosphoribosyl-dephospho-CoA synthase